MAASGACAGVGSGAAATMGFVGVTSDFFRTLAAAFFAAGRLRDFALLRLADLALRVVAAFLPAVLRLRVADFFPPLLRLGLMSSLPCGMGLDLNSRPLCKTCLLAVFFMTCLRRYKMQTGARWAPVLGREAIVIYWERVYLRGWMLRGLP